MKYTRSILSNGLTLVCLSDLSPNAVTIGAFIRAGVRFDPESQPGLSHFVEHMVFAGTKSYPTSRDLAHAVEQYGGWHSAFTWIEHQKHTMHLPKGGFEEGLKVFIDTIFNPLFKTADIKKEKGIVKEEILTNKADPGKAIWDYSWFPLLFAKTPLARPYSGTGKDIDKIVQKNLFSFRDTYFHTGNIVLFIAGDLKRSHVENLVENLTKDYKSNTKITEPYALKNNSNERVYAYQDDSYYQTSLMVGFKTVPFNSLEKYACEILRDMIAGSFGTPLIQKLRDENGLIYTWSAFQDNLSDMGYMSLNVSANHESVKKTCKLILEELGRLHEGNITKEEFTLAKSHLIGSLLANTQTGLDYIELYGLQELLTPENVLHLEQIMDIYKNITIEQLKNVAKKYLNKDNIFIATIGSSTKNDLLSQ